MEWKILHICSLLLIILIAGCQEQPKVVQSSEQAQKEQRRRSKINIVEITKYIVHDDSIIQSNPNEKKVFEYDRKGNLVQEERYDRDLTQEIELREKPRATDIYRYGRDSLLAEIIMFYRGDSSGIIHYEYDNKGLLVEEATTQIRIKKTKNKLSQTKQEVSRWVSSKIRYIYNSQEKLLMRNYYGYREFGPWRLDSLLSLTQCDIYDYKPQDNELICTRVKESLDSRYISRVIKLLRPTEDGYYEDMEEGGYRKYDRQMHLVEKSERNIIEKFQYDQNGNPVESILYDDKGIKWALKKYHYEYFK